MEKLVGRQREVSKLKAYANSDKSEFVAIYGRRRVGKTYLVRECFAGQFAFQVTGLNNGSMRDQLAEFHAALQLYSPKEMAIRPFDSWLEAFRQLTRVLESQASMGKKVVFLDELPWMDTPKSRFLMGLEHFWNSWASARRDILLIVCGSAASWMIKNLLNNKGGLHNRVTGRIKLEPFSLAETEEFLRYKQSALDRYQIIQLYMTLGGIPFYLDQVEPGKSAVQNINNLCFEKNAPLRSEYDNVYASLFKLSERHKAVVEALATKRKGLVRSEISLLSGISNGGGLTRILKELEESSFIRTYRSFGKKQQDTLYQLVDLYSLFYLNFIRNTSPDDENFWINAMESAKYRAWSGYAFEMVCLHHVKQIKKALGISGVQTSIYSWHSKDAQVDLVIDRKDQVVNLCEMKFSLYPFSITREYADKLRNKIAAFKMATKTRKSIFITMVTTFGLMQTPYAYMAQNEIEMNALFEQV
ncbi:MAG: ATPase [Saprospirales bacterium]|nr:ATPase [Saprospirales bacterium]